MLFWLTLATGTLAALILRWLEILQLFHIYICSNNKNISKMFPNTEEKPVSDGLFPFIVCCCCFARSRVEPRLFLHGGIAQISARLSVKGILYSCIKYLFKLQNVFVQIAKCICLNCQMYLSKLQIVSVRIAKCICPNCRMYCCCFCMVG